MPLLAVIFKQNMAAVSSSVASRKLLRLRDCNQDGAVHGVTVANRHKENFKVKTVFLDIRNY